MTRVVSLFLPNWSTDRLRRKAGDAAPPVEAPLVLIGREGNRRVVLAADAAAQAAGLRAGMPVAKAQVLAPGLIVQDADPSADAEALDRLAVWLLRFAPIVTPDPPDGIVIDSTGADHLHGGETAMLDGLIGRLAMSGISARAGIADTWGAAHALARYAARPLIIAPPGHGAAILERLPLAALRISPATVAGLQTLGFGSVGDLLAQPRAPLSLHRGAAALNDYARANDPFTRVGRQQIAVEISSVIRASPDSFRVAWIERRYENGQLAATERWTAILTIVIQTPRNAERLRANPLGIYVNAVSWSRELGQ